MATQVLLNPTGSGGDVFPFLALGKELQRRGHHVGIMTNPNFRRNVGQAGLEFIGIGTEESLRAIGKDPRLHSRSSAWKLALQWGALGTMRAAFDFLNLRRHKCPTVLVNSPLGFGTRLAAERFGIPLATAILSPYVLRSVYLSPVMPPLCLGKRVPPWLKSLQYWCADRFAIDRVLSKEVNKLRDEQSLPAIKRFLHRWCFCRTSISAFSRLAMLHHKATGRSRFNTSVTSIGIRPSTKIFTSA